MAEKEQLAQAHKISDILLVGQPNVGKSVLFSHLTGVRTITSNYPGTTVSYTSGTLRYGGENYTLIDAPGTYSLEPLDEASRVAVDLIDDASRVVHVLDATHLERHLPLTFEVLAQRKPTVVALNMTDEARFKGIHIDADKLSAQLGVPVFPIVAKTGEGVRDMINSLLSLKEKSAESIGENGHPGHHPHIPHEHSSENTDHHIHLNRDAIWQKVGAIVEDVQTLEHHHPTFGEKLEEVTIHPFWGTLFAIGVLGLSFALVRIIGEFLIGGGVGIFGDPWLELPFGTELLFEEVLKPLLSGLSGLLGEGSFLHRLLIGTLIDGEIDFNQSFGILTSGLFIPLGAVFPYLVSFYFVLSLLEDSGYLPRLAVFLDGIMHKIGLHGYAIIPTLLGLGCNVPGIMATRILETKQQRFITATLISIAVPCAALQAMIIGLLGDRGPGPLLVVYGTLFIVWLLVGLILRFTSKGFRPDILIEIPPYRVPDFKALLSKMWMRLAGFFKEALPVIIIAIFIVNILYQLKLFERVATLTEPLVTNLWGMPKESIVPLLIGVLRKDVAIGMFIPLQLSTSQLIVGSVVLSMFFPCIATFVVLFRELGLKDTIKSILVMLVAVVTVGTVLNIFV